MTCSSNTYVQQGCYGLTCYYFYCPTGYQYYYDDCCNYGWSEYGWIFWTFFSIFILLSIICGIMRKRRQRQMEEQILLNQQNYAPEREVVVT